MFKLAIVFISFWMISCTNQIDTIGKLDQNFEHVYFDTVEKEITFNTNTPNQLKNYINQWFENEIKVNGFSGILKVQIENYFQKEELILNGKKVSMTLDVLIIIEKPELNSTKKIKISLEEFGSISGNYSINEYERVVDNTMLNLIIRLSQDLKNRI